MGLIFRLFRLFATGNFRGIFTLLLGLTLVWGLWETALVRVSSRDTATAIMTEVGVDFVNPVLANGTFGVSQSEYATLQKLAQAHPTQALPVPGLKVPISGSDIAGKSFADGMRAIYGKVAAAYYDGGASGVFVAASPISAVISQFSSLTQAVASQGAQAAGAPQLPQVLQLLATPLDIAGLNPGLFTASGHAAAVMWDQRLLGAAAIFALLLMVFSPRLHRVSSVAWSVITGAAPGVIVLGLVWFLWKRSPATFAPYGSLLNLLGGAFVPVYLGAFAIGIGGIVVAKVGDVALKAAGIGKHTQARPAASSGFAAYGQSTWKAEPDVPRYRPYGSGSDAAGGQDAAWGTPPASPPQRQPSAGYGAASYGQPAQPAWPSATSGTPGSWRAADPGQPGRNAPIPGGWGPAGQAGQGGQPAWPQPGPAAWPESEPAAWPQPGQAGQPGQGGWDAQPRPGYGQSGQGRQPGSQSRPGQRGAWPPRDEDGWPGR